MKRTGLMRLDGHEEGPRPPTAREPGTPYADYVVERLIDAESVAFCGWRFRDRAGLGC